MNKIDFSKLTKEQIEEIGKHMEMPVRGNASQPDSPKDIQDRLYRDIEKQLKCAYCQKEKVKMEHFPFCSEECKLVDLYNWLSGEYVITDQ